MATIHVTLTRVKGKAKTGAPMPVVTSVEILAETVTSGAVSAQATIVPTDTDMFWNVTARTGDVWVKFGANPTAVSGAGHLVLTGQPRDFAVTFAGEKLAIKDA